jgi:hypothetical protein
MIYKTKLSFNLTPAIIIVTAILVTQAPAIGQAQNQQETTSARADSSTIYSAPDMSQQVATSSTAGKPSIATPNRPKPVFAPGTVGGPSLGQPLPGTIRDKIRADIETTNQNIKNNQEKRNLLVEKRPTGMPGIREASTTRPYNSTTSPQIPRPEIRGPKPGIIVPGISTTSLQVRLGEPGERREPMNFDMFRQRKENAAKQFEVAVNNLKNLRERIGSRIEKEQQNGKDMAKAKLLLGVADTKLTALKSAMDILKAYTPVKTDCEVQPRVANSTSTPRGSKDCINQPEVNASTTVNLDTARTLVENVQKAIRASQKALNDVIVEIAHSLGFKLGNPNENATSTPPGQGIPVSPRQDNATSPTPSTSPTIVPQVN